MYLTNGYTSMYMIEFGVFNTKTIFSRSVFFAAFLLYGLVYARAEEIPFDANYGVTWGNDHVSSLNQGREVRLFLDARSGAGFGSKLTFGSGFFHMRIKLPANDSAGVVTAFYLTSNSNHNDELDFEFLGNRKGKPVRLQTNVFVSGQGNREERILLWFDPTADFHTYKIMWNEHHIVFFIDKTPIRVFKNNTGIGVMYPTQPMKITASIWDGDSWATDGGKTKINWSHAPFIAHFQDFKVVGCPLTSTSNNNHHCYSSNYWWNQKKFWELNHKQRQEYERVRQKYMTYDYCADRRNHPIPPPECFR